MSSLLVDGPEYLAWPEEDSTQVHTALMGATTYRLISGFAALTATPNRFRVGVFPVITTTVVEP